MPDSIQDMGRHIYSTGLSELGCEHAGSEEFEMYGERFTGREDSEVDIYIPIKSTKRP